jgi:hypothetical protein
MSTMALECDRHYHITDDEGRKKQKFAIKRPFATFLTNATFDILIGAIKQIIERANGSDNPYYQVSLRSILRILLAHLRVADTNQCKLDKLLRLEQLHLLIDLKEEINDKIEVVRIDDVSRASELQFLKHASFESARELTQQIIFLNFELRLEEVITSLRRELTQQDLSKVANTALLSLSDQIHRASAKKYLSKLKDFSHEVI